MQERDFLKQLAEQWGDDINFYGVLHMATPGLANDQDTSEAFQRLAVVFGDEITQQAVTYFQLLSK